MCGWSFAIKSTDRKKNRVGIIGVGNWGRYGHIPILRLLPDFEIVAVASRRQEYAQEIARQFDVLHTFTDANELIKHPDIDLVIMLPPASQHTAFVFTAIDDGKDVYCEWPLTTNIADTEDLLARAQAADIHIHHLVDLKCRLEPSAGYVHDLLSGCVKANMTLWRWLASCWEC